MTVLSMVQSVCRRVGIPTPSLVVSATDETVLRLLELAQEEGRELARYGDWRVLRKEKTFTTVAAETQTDTPLPADLGGFIDNTFWNRTASRRLTGPLTSDQWQTIKANSGPASTDSFYLRGTSWLMSPVPAASQTIAYEYRSSYWCESSGGTDQEYWQADTDVGLISERLMGLGLLWRFKQSRGLDWQTDHEKYMFEVNDALAKDSPRQVVDLRGSPLISRGIGVPEGSWAL